MSTNKHIGFGFQLSVLSFTFALSVAGGLLIGRWAAGVILIFWSGLFLAALRRTIEEAKRKAAAQDETEEPTP